MTFRAASVLSLITLTMACSEEPPAVPGEPKDEVETEQEDCPEDDPQSQLWYLDGDGDGYGAGEPVRACEPVADHVLNGDDCDDTDPEINPDAVVDYCDGIDADCSGDEAATATVWRVNVQTGEWSEPQPVNDLVDGTSRTFDYYDTGVIALALCDVAAPIGFRVSRGGELRVKGFGMVELSPEDQLVDAGLGSISIEDVDVVDVTSDFGGILSCRGTALDLRNVVLDGLSGTGDANAIRVSNNCRFSGENVTISDWSGEDGPAIRMTGWGTSVRLVDSSVQGGTGSGTVGVFVGRDTHLVLDGTMFTEHMGRSVIFQEDESRFTCDGVEGVETGILRNDAAALEFVTSPDESDVELAWTLCDFGEGGDRNTIDMMLANGEASLERFGNDFSAMQ